MSIASQYIRAKGYPQRMPPPYSGVMGVIGSFASPSISESATVSKTPTATESISESATVTVT